MYAKNYHNDEHVDSFSKGGKHNLKKREPLKRDSLSTVFTCVQYSVHSKCTVQCPHVYSTVSTQSVQYSVHMCTVQCTNRMSVQCTLKVYSIVSTCVSTVNTQSVQYSVHMCTVE